MTHTIHTPAGHVRLDIRRVMQRRGIPLELFKTMERAELMSHIEYQAEQLFISVAARIAGKQFDQKLVSYPATWWDGFKLACLPTFCRWFRHAPHMTVVKLEASAFYPSIQIPNHKPFVQVTMKKQ
jgi:hypothetical protein